jgi:hypothetical protein
MGAPVDEVSWECAENATEAAKSKAKRRTRIRR